MHPGRKPRFSILELELDHLMHQSMWMGTALIESLILCGLLSEVKTGVARILQTKHNASDRSGSFSNERPQSYMVPDLFHLDVKIQSLSVLQDKVSMSTRLWDLDHSAGWRKYIRIWDLDHFAGWRKYILLWDRDHSVGWRKYIRLWNLDHSVGWRKYIQIWDLDHSAVWRKAGVEAFHVRCQRRIIGLEWRDFASNEEVRTRTRLVPLN